MENNGFGGEQPAARLDMYCVATSKAKSKDSSFEVQPTVENVGPGLALRFTTFEYFTSSRGTAFKTPSPKPRKEAIFFIRYGKLTFFTYFEASLNTDRYWRESTLPPPHLTL